MLVLATLAVMDASGTSIKAQQTTTNTNCNVLGSTVNCTSTSTDNSAQQQRSYEAGQQVGNALGLGMAAAMQSHSRAKWVKRYCAANPGQSWRWTRNSDGYLLASGRCPTAEDEARAAANSFLAKHRDYIVEPANAELLTAYIETHRLDPREEKSYERGYKDLKKSGQLRLYAR